MKRLSILIPSTPERNDVFQKLYLEVKTQVEKFENNNSGMPTVEILFDDSPRFLDGGLSIGMKRESLKNRATGQYLCFLDSDESISPNYIETLMMLCEQEKDVCTFRAMVKLENSWGLVDMKLLYLMNDEYTPEHDVRRRAWHICPVRTEFARLYSFEDINSGEDFFWMKQVLAHCTTEAHTDRIIFQYNHNSKSESDAIINAGHL